MKRTAIIAAVVLAILLVAWIVASFGVTRGLRHAIGRVGSRLTQTPVSVEQVDVALLSGRISLYGLVIANPPGYSTPAALRLDRIDIALVPRSLLTDRIDIRSIDITGPEVTYEHGIRDSNISTLSKNIKQATATAEVDTEAAEPAAPAATATGTDSPAAAPAPAEPATRVVIDRLTVREGTIRITADLMQGQTFNIPLPTVELTEIGRDQNGTTFDNVAAALLDAIIQAALSGSAISTRIQEGKLDGAAKVKGLIDGFKGLIDR